MDILSLSKQAIEYLQQGQYAESAECYVRIIEIEPDTRDHYWHLGLCYLLLERDDEAEFVWGSVLLTENFEIIEEKVSELIIILEKTAIQALEVNNIPNSKKIYDKIVELDSTYNNPIFAFFQDITQWQNRIFQLMDSQSFQAAIAELNLILAIAPDLPMMWNCLAVSYYLTQEYTMAVNAINQAVNQAPNEALFHYNAGLIFSALGHQDASILAYKQAIALNPQMINAYLNLGNLYLDLNLLEKARDINEEGYKENPASIELAFNLFDCLMKLDQIEEAQDLLKARLEIFPNEVIWKIANLLELPLIYSSKNEIMEVRNRFSQGLDSLYNQLELDLKDDVKKRQYLTALEHHNNFYLPYQGFNDLELQKKYGQIIQKIIQANFTIDLLNPKKKIAFVPGNKIRVGFISTNFIEHPGTKWLWGWMQYINKSEFEIYCYHLGNKLDNATTKFRSLSDHFYHLTQIQDAIQHIHAQDLNILIYADIGMDALTIRLAAMRLAPIQCNSWGHPVTSGLSTIDYFLSSELMEPENGQEHYSEKLIRLPNLGICYQKSTTPTQIKNRQYFGLEEERVVYLSCQTFF